MTNDAMAAMAVVVSDIIMHDSLLVEIKRTDSCPYVLIVSHHNPDCKLMVGVANSGLVYADLDGGKKPTPISIENPEPGSIAANIYELMNIARPSQYLNTVRSLLSRDFEVTDLLKSSHRLNVIEYFKVNAATTRPVLALAKPKSDNVAVTMRNGDSLDLWYSRQSPMCDIKPVSIRFSRHDWYSQLVEQLNKWLR